MTDEEVREVDMAITPPLQWKETIASLKRIHKSIQFWQKRGGRRGYYDEYVRRFMGRRAEELTEKEIPMSTDPVS
jgi:hypothetical protein